MQSYQDHMPMEPPELLSSDPEEYKKQIESAFDRGADEVKIFKPTPRQLANMKSGKRKKKLRAMKRESRRVNRKK